jgi:hypothetical protein
MKAGPFGRCAAATLGLLIALSGCDMAVHHDDVGIYYYDYPYRYSSVYAYRYGPAYDHSGDRDRDRDHDRSHGGHYDVVVRPDGHHETVWVRD